MIYELLSNYLLIMCLNSRTLLDLENTCCYFIICKYLLYNQEKNQLYNCSICLTILVIEYIGNNFLSYFPCDTMTNKFLKYTKNSIPNHFIHNSSNMSPLHF